MRVNLGQNLSGMKTSSGSRQVSGNRNIQKQVAAHPVIRHDDKHFEALAYPNGAAACLPKPVSAGHLAGAIRPKLEPALT